MFEITDEISDILVLGYSLATEENYLPVLDLVLDGCMKFTGADSGNLYLEHEGNLVHVTGINHTIGYYKYREEEVLPEDLLDMQEHNIVVYCANHKKILNIPDIYQEEQFEIPRIKDFDVKYEYRTQSVLMVPFYKPGNEILGVMQLMNCKDDDGQIIPFPEEYEALVNSLTSQMAVAITNQFLIQDLREMLDSFVNAMTTAIDARTPYNANHTRHVGQYCREMVEYINQLYTKMECEFFFNEHDKAELYMAAMLHDIGKIITPREVLNKASRLGNLYDNLANKLEKIRLLKKIDHLEGRLSDPDYTMEDLYLDNFIHRLPDLNYKDHLTEDDIEKIDSMSKMVYHGVDGTEIPYLDEEEKKSLNIRNGTLTAEERAIVQQHVEYTEKLLSEISFSKDFSNVKRIASNHHEYLNGTGYPKGLTAEDLDISTRLLTIVDIYDSLTSTDRPYKGPIPVPKALSILEAMVEEGKLDGRLVKIVKDYMLEKNNLNGVQ